MHSQYSLQNVGRLRPPDHTIAPVVRRYIRQIGESHELLKAFLRKPCQEGTNDPTFGPELAVAVEVGKERAHSVQFKDVVSPPHKPNTV